MDYGGLTGTIPESWRLPEGLQVHALVPKAFQLWGYYKAWHIFHTTINAQSTARPSAATLAPPLSPSGATEGLVFHLPTMQIPVAVQMLTLHLNQLTGTIPESWQLPDSLQASSVQNK